MAKDVISGRDIKSSAEDNLRRMGAGALDDVVSAIDRPTRKAKQRKRTGKQKGRGVLGATVFDV